MSRPLFVYLVPQLFQPEEVQDGIVVVLDILRASTTIVHALVNGASSVIPVGDVETAQQIASQQTPGTVLLGGEREGVLISGFDLDNNPFAYNHETVTGKTIVFTTTNGTAALQHSKAAQRILIGAFVNLNAVVQELLATDLPVHLVCAGTRKKVSLEDALCAGAIANQLLAQAEFDATDDQMQIVVDSYRQKSVSPETFRAAMRASFGGRNCMRLGFEKQIDRAGTLNLFELVPEFQPESGKLIPAPK